MQEDKVRFYAANWPQDHWPNFAFNELAPVSYTHLTLPPIYSV